VGSGSFSAPDHEYPSYLELRLTATVSGGLSDTKTLRLDPNTATLTFQSSPGGLQLTVGSSSSQTPFTRTVIPGIDERRQRAVAAALGTTNYQWQSWSDGGAATHNIVASTSATYTATYQAVASSSADLALAKSGSLSGTTATWTLTVTNIRPGTAERTSS
jgi:hypothetical protein